MINPFRALLSVVRDSRTRADTDDVYQELSATLDTAGLIDRGIDLASKGRIVQAIATFTEAIAMAERLRARLEPEGSWSPTMRGHLFFAYFNRGYAKFSEGHLAEAVADYGRSVEVAEGLRDFLEPRGAWSADMRNHLIRTLASRGRALECQQLLREAIADYDRIVALEQEQRTQLEREGRWPPNLRLTLAEAYSVRGLALYSQGRFIEAVADYDQAISIGEGARDLMDHRGEWSPNLANTLAANYINRANALQRQDRLSDAIADYDRAISLQERLRALLEFSGHWSPSLRNALAWAHTNKGNALESQGTLVEAVTAHGQAITIWKNLRVLLEPSGEWSAEFHNNLATAYSNRGVALASQRLFVDALADFEQAIAMEEELHSLLEPTGKWSAEFRNDLAMAYSNRGMTLDALDRSAEASEDRARALALREDMARIVGVPPRLR